MSVEELLQAISELSLDERAELERRLHGWQDDGWDRQIQADVDEGKFDATFDRIRSDVKAGRLTDLP